MRTFASLLSAALLLLLAAPLRAQQPDINHLSVNPPIKVYGTSPGPVIVTLVPATTL